MNRLLKIGVLIAFVLAVSPAWAQKTVRLSIATGGTGGSYYPMGGGMANIISKYIPYAAATAEVTAASIDNCLLIGKGSADLAFMNADTAWDAYHGKGKAFKEKIPLRTLAVWSPSVMQIVTTEGKGIQKVSDLKGKRIATGAPGSNTEVIAIRILEAYGLDPNKDVNRERLSISESAGALKDRKIDAFLWVGGLPAAAVTDLAATPGIKIKLLDHSDAVTKIREKYGPFYVIGTIPAKTYPGQDRDVQICAVWNLVVCHENMKENIAYDIIKALFDHKPELLASHGDVKYFTLAAQGEGGSPIPFHPGVVRYLKEKGIKIQ
jgi:TRAP transporter TAXI family solute receptor